MGNLNDTIAAISTAIGEAGIAIVRMSGDDSINIIDKIFKSASGLMDQMDIFTDGAMTIVQRPRGRWAAALVPVLFVRQWVTACKLVSLTRGCLRGGTSLPVEVSKENIG